jgi:5-methylcytosine-specific restriction endonuclease McrA
VAACRSCNERKGGRTPEEAGMRLLAPVRSARYILLERFRELVGDVA